MVQFYLLSIVANLLTGSLLFLDGKKTVPAKDKSEDAEKKVLKIPSVLSDLVSSLSEKGTKFVLGLTSLVIGICKILSPMPDANVVMAGDLLPVISGITIGGVLLLDFFKSTSKISSELIQKIDSNILQNKKYFGIAAIIIGALHFFLPGMIIF